MITGGGPEGSDQVVPAAAPLPGVPAELYVITEAERSTALFSLVRACSAGQMTLEEFSRRTDLTVAATTRAELVAASGDLDLGVSGTPALKRRWFVLLGHRIRRGRFVLPERTTAFMFAGEIYLDLRQATLVGPEPTIKLWVLAGNINILVPRGIRVESDQSSLFGGRSITDHDAGTNPAAPTLRVRMIDLLGSIRVSNDPDEWGRGLITRKTTVPGSIDSSRPT